MKQQMSRQTLIEDFKCDWPRRRTALPKLLESLENTGQQNKNSITSIDQLQIN